VITIAGGGNTEPATVVQADEAAGMVSGQLQAAWTFSLTRQTFG
jgi:hypothetical protein